MRRRDITGERFGRLLVIKFAGVDEHRQSLWKCQCDCGKITVKRGYQLTQGRIKSCGCYRRETAGKLAKKYLYKQGHIKKDITGERFGRWQVISLFGKKNGKFYWNCICDCGTEKEISGNSLSMGKTKSCGCLKTEKLIIRSTKHGHCSSSGNSKEYRAYYGMITRCYNKNLAQHKDYGGRGIKVADEWLDSNNGFVNFLRDVGPCPGPEYSLDRIDNDGNYEPGNIRWATIEEQALNRSDNRILSFNGESLSMTEWGNKYGLKCGILHNRIDRLGWDIEKALSTPVKKKPWNFKEYNGKIQNISQWSRELKIERKTLIYRLDKLGWDIEKAFTTPVNKRRKRIK